jgi:hypothetical protein
LEEAVDLSSDRLLMMMMMVKNTKVKFVLEQSMKARDGSRNTALLLL